MRINWKKKPGLHLFFPKISSLIVIIGLCLSFFGVNAQTDQPGVRMQAYPINQGYFKYGEWLLVWTEIENNGSDLNATLQVRVAGSSGSVVYSVPVDLPSGSRKRVPIYVLPNNFGRELEIQLVANGGLISSDKVKINPQLNNTYLIGIISESRGALSMLNGAKIPPAKGRPLVIVDLKIDELPEQVEGLQSLDALILNDVDTSTMNIEQKEAVESWVRQGGRLVVGGGAGAHKTLAGLPAELIPIDANQIIEINDLKSLETFTASRNPEDVPTDQEAYPIRVPGPFLIATGKQSESRIIISEGETPLVVEKNPGKGSVLFVSLDLSTSPFDAWNGTTAFWEKLLSPGAEFPNWIPTDTSGRQQMAAQIPYMLSNLPMLDLPSTRLLAFWLLLYIILIGPVNYFVLRWKNRLHWAWITIPAITLFFSIGAFSLGYFLHGTDVFVNKISILEISPDGTGTGNSYIGIFSPAQRGYEIEVSGDGLISAMSPFYNPWDTPLPAGNAPSARELTLIQSEPSKIKGLSIDQWSMNSFAVEGIKIEPGKIIYDLQMVDQELVGYVRNESNLVLKDAVILLNKSIYRLGNLAPGQEMSVEFTIPDLDITNYGLSLSYSLFQDQLNRPGQNGPPPREVEVKRQIVETIFERIPAYPLTTGGSGKNIPTPRATPFLLGWIDQSPPEVKVQDSEPGQQTTAVVLMPIEYTLPDGEVSLPTGTIPGELIQAPLDGGTCGEPGSTSVYLNQGSGIFEFSLLARFSEIIPDQLRLSLWNDSGVLLTSPEISIYDWISKSWTVLSGIQSGVNLIPQAANFIDGNGKIRVRVGPVENAPGCYFIALGMEGKQP